MALPLTRAKLCCPVWALKLQAMFMRCLFDAYGDKRFGLNSVLSAFKVENGRTQIDL
ncbi:hypothetical protein SBDP1_140005 [Syntrophobacter sp. SbD1]|nr:hypothetical protein SBDP1_140005 [Syntrophobacter sp. SbD1]